MIAVSCGSSNSKPSKKELTDHLVELVLDEGDLGGYIPKDVLEKMYGCIVDEIYDDLSDEHLKEMAGVKKIDENSQYPIKLSKEEEKSFDDAIKNCGEKYSGELGLETQPPEE